MTNHPKKLEDGSPDGATGRPPPPPGLTPRVRVAVSPQAVIASDDLLYQDLLQNLYDGALITDFSGVILDANVRALGILLAEKSDICGHPISDYISGVDAALLQTALHNLADQRFTQIEGYCLRKDGSLFPGDVVVSRLQHAGQELLCFFIRDITRRKAVEEQLLRTKEAVQNHAQFLEALFTAMPNPVFYRDREGRYLGCNAAYEKLMGKNADQIVGRKAGEIWPSEQARSYHENDEALINSPGIQVYEDKVRSFRGENLDVIFNKSTFLQADGEIAGIIGVILDITDRKRMEEDLRRSEARNRALLSAMPDTMFRSSGEGVIHNFKAGGCCEPVGEPLGRPVAEVLPWMAKPFMESTVRALAEKTPQVFESELRQPQGVVFFETRVVACGEAEVLAIVRDITARKRSEQAAREMEERDMEIARAIQKVLLPASFPRRLAADFGAFYVPAQKLGGDYYDLIEVDEEHVGIAIADVSGKGMAGALLMTMCRSVLRMRVTANFSPAQTLKQLNSTIYPDMREDKFISMVYGVLNIRTRIFTFCRAGHEPLLLFRPSDQSVRWLAPKGMALGIDGGQVFDRVLTEERMELKSGDILLFYTDGITEALNGEGKEFGRDRLLEVVRACAARSAGEITAAVEQAVAQFVGKYPQSDDMTLLVFRMPS